MINDGMLKDDETASYAHKSLNEQSGAVSDAVLSSDDWMERLELTVNLDIGCSLKPRLLEHIKLHC